VLGMKALHVEVFEPAAVPLYWVALGCHSYTMVGTTRPNRGGGGGAAPDVGAGKVRYRTVLAHPFMWAP
jgi:hypothetical protein